MEVQAYKLHIVHFECTVYHLIHVLHADTKLVLCKSGGDIGMGMCTDIRIDAESYSGNFSFCCCQLVDYFQFWNRLYIKAENVVI